VKAIRVDNGRIWVEAKAEAPGLESGEAMIRPLRMGVCARDVSVPGPITLGQEFVGVVEKLHADADRDLCKRWEGKRIVGSPGVACGRCDLCKAGLASHCRARRVMGVTGWDGCFAERFKLPLRNLVEVPANVHDDAAVFALALADAAHAAHLVRIEGKTYVTVLGDGVPALLCAQALVRLNASVRLLGQRPDNFGLCERWGIKHRHIGDVGRRADQDVVVDATQTGAGIDLALQLVRPRGKIVLTGHPSAAPPSLAPLVESEVELVGARGGSLSDAVAMLARAEVDPLPLITRRMKLADGPAALRAAQDPDQIKVLLEP
jgi:threonine dehydrogenase-like Zn-dependent dehydrogenase